MKFRAFLAIILIAGIISGMFWWMPQASAAEPSNTASTPQPEPSQVAPSANGMAPLSPRNINVPPASTVAGVPAATSPYYTPAKPSDKKMGIRFAVGPADGPALILDDVRYELNRGSGSIRKIWAGVDISALKIRPPLPIYELDAIKVLNGGGLETARARNGFMYILEASGQAEGEGYVNVDDSGAAWLEDVAYGNSPDARATLQALDQVDVLGQMLAGSYEARAVNFGGSRAIWLKSDSGGADLIYTISSEEDGVKSGKLYTADEFLAVLRSAIQKDIDYEKAHPNSQF